MSFDFGRPRWSTLALIVLFVGSLWSYLYLRPKPTPTGYQGHQRPGSYTPAPTTTSTPPSTTVAPTTTTTVTAPGQPSPTSTTVPAAPRTTTTLPSPGIAATTTTIPTTTTTSPVGSGYRSTPSTTG